MTKTKLILRIVTCKGLLAHRRRGDVLAIASRYTITGNIGGKWPRVLAAVLNAVGAGIAAVVSAQPCHPTYHTRMRALCVTVKKPSNHHVQDRKEASRRSRERRELTEETRPTSLRPGGVVAPEVAGLLSKASPRPSTAPLPSFPSPNPPHFLTVIWPARRR